MKNKTLYLFLITYLLPLLVFSQNEDWFKKADESKDPKQQIEFYTKALQVTGANNYIGYVAI